MSWSPDKASAIVFSDPLSSLTEGRKKVLLFISCFCVLLTVYGLKVTKTPWLDMDVPAGAPNILHGTMAVALVYSFCSYALYLWTDIRRWLTAGDVKLIMDMWNTHQAYKIAVEDIKLKLSQSADTLAHPAARKSLANSEAFFDQLQGEIMRFQRSHVRLSFLQYTRIGMFDLAIPLGIGIFAFTKIYPALGPFLAAIGNSG